MASAASVFHRVRAGSKLGAQYDQEGNLIQVETREDEEQTVKLSEILELLLAAGYFRARIKGLSPFDKVVGGMTWCITTCNFDIDVDLLFQENSTIGQKIALTEKIVSVLPKMKCPHRLEPHQIQGLDFIHIFPVIQWLVKRAIETREEMGDYVRSYSVSQFQKNHSLPEDEEFFQRKDKAAGAVLDVQDVYKPQRKYRRQRDAEQLQDEESRVHSTLLEYGRRYGFSKQSKQDKTDDGKTSLSGSQVVPPGMAEVLEEDNLQAAEEIRIKTLMTNMAAMAIEERYPAPSETDRGSESEDDAPYASRSGLLVRQIESLANDIERFDPNTSESNIDDYLREIERCLLDLPAPSSREKLKLIWKTTSRTVHGFMETLPPDIRDRYSSLCRALRDEYATYADSASATMGAFSIEHGRNEPPREYYRRLKSAYFQGRNGPGLEEDPAFRSLINSEEVLQSANETYVSKLKKCSVIKKELKMELETKHSKNTPKMFKEKYRQQEAKDFHHLERVHQKRARLRNHLRFNLTCRDENITPISLQLKTQIRTKTTQNIMERAQRALLKERIRNATTKQKQVEDELERRHLDLKRNYKLEEQTEELIKGHMMEQQEIVHKSKRKTHKE
ncbi:transcript variant X2, partial [Nothobranchius furzeri]